MHRIVLKREITVLENTAHATDKVPNTLALVASQMVVEKAKEFKEQARQQAEEARRADNARARDRLLEKLDKPSADASSSNDAPIESAPSKSDAPAQPDPRGTVVDLNV